jgi:hypothetical protein
MGVTSTDLSRRYPVLYHMASYGSWPSIRTHGLLSTLELLDLFEVPDPTRTELLTSQRRKSVQLAHPVHGTAILRDQKPLSEKNLARCLTDCDAATWYSILNQRVFFWLDHQRLMTLMSAAEYAGRPHTVLQIETAELVRRYEDRIELAHMNTGNTRPFPHPRGRSTFKRMGDYPYELRRHLPDYSAVVELTAAGGVPDLSDFVIRVEHAAEVEGRYEVSEVLFQRT